MPGVRRGCFKALKTAEKNEEVRQQPVEGFDPAGIVNRNVIRKLANCDGCTTTIAVTLSDADCFRLCTRTETVIVFTRCRVSYGQGALRLRTIKWAMR